MNEIDRFDHLTIVVSDLAPACAAYEVLFGRPAVWRGVHPELGTEAALFGCWNGLVELVAPSAGDERSAGLRDLLAQRGAGPLTLAFGTGDADACFAALRARRVPVAPPEPGEARGVDGAQRSYRVLPISPRRSRGIQVLAVERTGLDGLVPSAPPAADQFEAIDHVVVRTSDPDAALAFYGEDLGLRLALDRELSGIRMLFFRVGGVTIEVVTDASAGDQDGLYGIAYRVQDLEACHGRLAAAGLDVSEPRAGNKAGTRVFSVRSGTCSVPTLVLWDPSRPPQGKRDGAAHAVPAQAG